MIQLENICLSFLDKTIFNELSCSLQKNAHIGLVGRNGSGKSTLLKAIAGSIELDSGTISIQGGTRIAYMPQDIVLNSQKNIIEEVLEAFEALQPEDIPSATATVKKTLIGLGFTDEKCNVSVNQLSTGWKMRLVLAKLLLTQADFYLFDEPTNHLDIVAQEWFLQFLKSAKFGFLLVCHERAFLNKVCSQILELEQGNGMLYNGNYDSYIKQKEYNAHIQQRLFETQQKDIARKKDTIARFKAKASKASMAQSMQKALNKMEIVTPPAESSKIVAIQFPPIEQSGKAALRVSKLSKSFNNKPLFSNATFRIERATKVALVAANGVGKTTLFKCITGEYPIEDSHGSIIFGEKVHYALFKQDQNISLNHNATIWQEVSTVETKKNDTEIRAFLGAFLFTGDDIYKPIKVLSGGEKNRVSMVKTLLKTSNFLLLDEPTNHLDIQSKDVLLSALKNYPGTILFVSHDHDFVNQLATHIIELTPHETIMYTGNYDDFLMQKKHSLTIALENQKNNSDTKTAINKTHLSHQTFEKNKKIRNLETKLARLEQKRDMLNEKLGNCDYKSPEYKVLFEDFTATEKSINITTREWEELYSE